MQLEPLKITDYALLKPFFAGQRHHLCAYSLPSILAWRNDVFKPIGMVTADSLIVAVDFSEPKDNRHLILPISPCREYTPLELQDLALDLGFEKYWYVPNGYLDRHDVRQVEAFFKIEAQPHLHDYVYRFEDLAYLKGNRYSKKRNLINQFNRCFANRGQVILEPITPATVPECEEFLDRWCEERACEGDSEDELGCERQAIINSMAHLERFELDSLLLRLDGKISAMAITARLTDKMGVMHFQKAFAHVKGLYQYFDQQCAQRLFRGYDLINKESDMGLAGLIQAKKSYHPIRKIRSYKLTVK